MVRKACYQTASRLEACLACGRKDKSMHMPIGRVGRFCRRCCPECAGEREEQATVYRLTDAGRKYLPQTSKRLRDPAAAA
jgi:hypothetical protein